MKTIEKTGDSDFQLIVNELFGQTGTDNKKDKEELLDISDEFICQWIVSKVDCGYSTETIHKAMEVYFFLNRLIRHAEISFEEAPELV